MKAPKWLCDRLQIWAENKAQTDADVYIGGRANPYLKRWFVIPRNRFFNIYLHEFRRDDEDRALHDHPWVSFSIALRGKMTEHRQGGRERVISARDMVYRRSVFSHRLALNTPSAMTLFFTGPRIREWGFHCGKDTPAGGWRHWKEFTDPNDTGNVGRGCD